MPENVKHLPLATIHEYTPSPFAKNQTRYAEVVIPNNPDIRATISFFEANSLVSSEKFFAGGMLLKDAKTRAQQFANGSGQYKPQPVAA